MRDEYEWTLTDVTDAFRRAELQRMKFECARTMARNIEREYWTAVLVKKFPELEWKVDGIGFRYLATIAFSDADQQCLVRGPMLGGYGGTHVLVWHRGSKGKLHKTATEYRCDEIVPFIRSVTLLKEDGKEAVA